MNPKCPGQDKRNIEARNIICQHCGYSIEIFSDEFKISCPGCKKTVYQQVMPSCIEWCKSAAECVGEVYLRKHGDARILRAALIRELETYFGSDIKRIAHAKKVLSFAEELLKNEHADWNIVVPTAILHDMGIKAATALDGVVTDRRQEALGAGIAREILLRLKVPLKDIEEICVIVAHHHSPAKAESMNFKVLYDADQLVNLRERMEGKSRKAVIEAIEKTFFTDTAKAIARKVYLS